MGRSLRSGVFSASEICICHGVQRWVRRAWLAGVDEKTGKDYSYRKEWIRRRLEALASTWSVDVLTYAIMSNHIHVILRNRPDVVATWSDEEAATRWPKVFPGRRIEEQLAAPSESDIKAAVNDAEHSCPLGPPKALPKNASSIDHQVRTTSLGANRPCHAETCRHLPLALA